MTAEADKVNIPSNLRSMLTAWMQEQWTRIPPVPYAQPGSYDRGYQNGMADILRGVTALLDKAPDETKSLTEPGYVPWDDEDVRRFPGEAARIMREQRAQLMELRAQLKAKVSTP